MTMTLCPGDKAPEFDVTSSDGKALRLADFRGKKNVVLYFYPRDFSAVCTRETCGFRDMYADLVSQDTEIIGVSTDDNASHEAFRKEHNVPFPLVADTTRALQEAYGANDNFLLQLIGRVSRQTFLIDKTGTIAGIFHGELSAKAHTDGIKSALVRLDGSAKSP
jgi:peroxiredoxin Q/BCP